MKRMVESADTRHKNFHSGNSGPVVWSLGGLVSRNVVESAVQESVVGVIVEQIPNNKENGALFLFGLRSTRNQ